MKRQFAATLTALSLASCAAQPGMQSANRAAPEVAQLSPDQAFADLGARYLDAMAQLSPVYATQLGDHRFDGQLPDITAAGRDHAHKVTQSFLAALKTIDPAQLTPDNQVDYALLKNQLEYSLWQDDVLQEWAWNPQYYNDTASYALYGLVARDFAPWPQRFVSIVERMEKLPAFLAESRRQIDVARVPKIYAETVSRQNAGIMEIVEAALLPEVEGSGVDRTRFDRALAGLKAAVAEHQKWIDEVLVPGAKGDFRLGAEKYDTKMRFALMSTMDRATLKSRAEKAFVDTRMEMESIARTLPGCDLPDQQAAIECGLQLTYAKRASRSTLEQTARETLADATAFAEAKQFVRMPDGKVQVITMPKFWQGNAVAYDDPPGPLERNLPNFYAVSPIPDDWSDEQADSFLREYNIYMLHDLSIHEGMPGHYLQLDHANQSKSVLRAVLSSGPFVEGWAVYAEGMMADEGYLGGMATMDGKLFRLTMLKMRLRSVTNTLLDIGIHTEGMSREDAMKLMMDGAFQQEREAAGKWVRANLSSVQLLSYFTGYAEHMALREEAKRRWGEGFTLRRYNDAVLSHGSPPVKYARALMFEEPIPAD
ncbi:MAG: DUF885 domain-containing protein [Sphingomonadales bacterium]|nr:DUF885 domain-containing protein [Sphingomonadales bacterium]MBD3774383.1 DUF885 domain-containing protein [Paracoccaceae bacterium]